MEILPDKKGRDWTVEDVNISWRLKLYMQTNFFFLFFL